jgi:phosphoglycolate phosphatase
MMSFLGKKKGIIFDLDGTLVDSINETAVILNKMRGKRGKLPLSKDKYKKLISHGAAELVQYACGKGENCENLIDEFRGFYKLTKTSKDSIFPGVLETLTKLKQTGVKLAICTNKPENLCTKVLQDTGLISYFDSIVAGGMTKRPKPSSDPIVLTIKNLKLNPDQVILVGDSTVDQEATKAANIPFIFFTGGYDDGVENNSVDFLIDCITMLSK